MEEGLDVVKIARQYPVLRAIISLKHSEMIGYEKDPGFSYI